MSAVNPTSSPLLEMRRITKRFPGLVALDNVDFSVNRGEIHALIGQNGAGKSTLMKVLAGVYPLEDNGQIWIDGTQVHFNHPRAALQTGIGIVYQDRSLVPKLTVAQNIFLGREPGGVVIDQTEMEERSLQIMERAGVHHIPVDEQVGNLSLAQQQLVEISKVLSYEPRILVMDEPTAALAEEETELLLGLLRGLREEGIGIIYISHRFKEILNLCDRATILRNGKVVHVTSMTNVTEEELIEQTIGSKIQSFYQTSRAEGVSETAVLEVENLSVGRHVDNVSFSVKQGEIVGITGLLGAGQNELARALFGIMPEVSGLIKRGGKPVLIHSPKAAINLGIGLLTEHRKTEGLVLEMNVRSNMTLPSLARFSPLMWWIKVGREESEAGRYMNELAIKAPSLNTIVGTLSGGNQQKVILSRWLLRDLDVFIFISPTQGIDVGAKAEIYHQLSELAAQGKSILVVSEDHLEILNISDRVFVMYGGRLLRIYRREELDEELLLSAIQGNVAS